MKLSRRIFFSVILILTAPVIAIDELSPMHGQGINNADTRKQPEIRDAQKSQKNKKQKREVRTLTKIAGIATVVTLVGFGVNTAARWDSATPKKSFGPIIPKGNDDNKETILPLVSVPSIPSSEPSTASLELPRVYGQGISISETSKQLEQHEVKKRQKRKKKKFAVESAMRLTPSPEPSTASLSDIDWLAIMAQTERISLTTSALKAMSKEQRARVKTITDQLDKIYTPEGWPEIYSDYWGTTFSHTKNKLLLGSVIDALDTCYMEQKLPGTPNTPNFHEWLIPCLEFDYSRFFHPSKYKTDLWCYTIMQEAALLTNWSKTINWIKDEDKRPDLDPQFKEKALGLLNILVEPVLCCGGSPVVLCRNPEVWVRQETNSAFLIQLLDNSYTLQRKPNIKNFHTSFLERRFPDCTKTKDNLIKLVASQDENVQQALKEEKDWVSANFYEYDNVRTAHIFLSKLAGLTKKNSQ